MAVATDKQAKTPLFAWLAVLLPLVMFVAFASLVDDVAGGAQPAWRVDWIPQLGIRLSFFIDGLGLLFALMITGVGAFIFLYCTAYLRGYPQVGRFTLFLALFMLAMVGLVLADNLITLFVFWELTTLTSFMLIGYDHESANARRAALQGLIVTGSGGLAMLAGFILLGQAAGSYELTEILRDPAAVRAHPHYVAILVLVLCGAFTKSAQFPFHFWLPNAMAAPTPVSAYLHSATMVKAGVYLLARLNPALGETALWMIALTCFGAFTAVYASAIALKQRDMKQMLAYTTLMALGTCVMFLGAASEIGLIAAVTFILAHALYKAALFLVVGIIDHQAGTRDLTALGGLRGVMPFTALAALLAALSMAGMPPFIGFVGKELLYKGALAWAPEPVIAIAATLAAKVMIVTVALMLALAPFFGARRPTPAAPREAPWTMWLGPLVFGVVALVGGLVPDMAGDKVLLPAAAAVMNARPTYVLSLWHGLSVPLALSLLTFLAGWLVYRRRTALRARLEGWASALPVTGDRAYDAFMAGVAAAADWQTRRLQHGIHRFYILVVFATLAVAVGATFLLKGGLVLPAELPDLRYYEWAVAALIVGGTLLVLRPGSRLRAICGLGVVGAGVAFVFLMFGAPDVAMTQFLVETLLVVLLALVLLKLPPFRGARSPRGRSARMRDAAVSIACGLVMAGLVLSVSADPPDPALTAFFELAAVPEAFGRNIVNVILVDFRALDTFGEVIVVAVAGLTAYALIKLRARPGDGEGER